MKFIFTKSTLNGAFKMKNHKHIKILSTQNTLELSSMAYCIVQTNN